MFHFYKIVPKIHKNYTIISFRIQMILELKHRQPFFVEIFDFIDDLAVWGRIPPFPETLVASETVTVKQWSVIPTSFIHWAASTAYISFWRDTTISPVMHIFEGRARVELGQDFSIFRDQSIHEGGNGRERQPFLVEVAHGLEQRLEEISSWEF